MHPGDALLGAQASVPRSTPCTAATASCAARTCARIRSASTSSARPASVSVTLRVVRTNNGVCSSRSRERIDARKARLGDQQVPATAARVKCWSSATATKC
ncbi:hypothetical protein SHIRM173S_01503 [Streptomyces hirsutus]